MSDADPILERWRMVLGKFSAPRLGNPRDTLHQKQERALEHLYGREYRGRNIHDQVPGPGSLDASQLDLPRWLDEVRRVFPKSTVEHITRHALERYELTDLIDDPKVLATLEPDIDLLRLMLGFKGRCKPAVLPELRRIIDVVVADLTRELSRYVRQSFAGRINRHKHSNLRIAGNFDWKTTIRDNLKHFNPERGVLVPQQIRFNARIRREIPWDIILCVDQSGSMAASLIYSAVMAGIFSGLPSINVKLVVFDTAVVDLSDLASDPLEVLMAVQLGGGTNIGGALGYCQSLVKDPKRSILILVSDFYEGGSPRDLFTRCRQLHQAGIRLLGLAALDPEAEPFYDRETAGKLAACGMEIAALTPKELTQWLKATIS